MRSTGRTSRWYPLQWLLAVPALLVHGGFFAMALLWVLTESSPLRQLQNPLCWGSFAGVGVAVAALPAVDRRLRGSAARWLAAPFLITFAVFVASAGEVIGRVGPWYQVALVDTGLCGLLVARYLVAPGGEVV
ncbi:MAG: hypothetical protein H6838_10770 [Planctomycetes bacterium]|nr:hypothetical protein [Planctomycetota bacterium]MCB9885969.1 hypothetical protein [Planctomycetota bacterium]